MYWLAVITVAVWYNFWTVILRSSFDVDSSTLLPMWLVLDYVFGAADSACMPLTITIAAATSSTWWTSLCGFDVHHRAPIAPMLRQIRTGFIKHGLLVTDARLIMRSYVQKRQYMDILSVIPLELIFLPLGYNPAWRFNRLLKFGRWMRFESKFEHRTSSANVWRLVFLMHKLMVVLNFDACFYFLISKTEGFGTNDWVMPAAEASKDTCTGCVDAGYAKVNKQYANAFSFASASLMVCRARFAACTHSRRLLAPTTHR